MSLNRGAAIQAIAARDENKRPVFDIMSENANRDRDIMIIRDLFTILDGVSKWETSNEPIHVPGVYQVTFENINPNSVLPGRWSQNVG